MVKSNGHFYMLSDLQSKNIQPRNFHSWHGLIDAIPANWKKELKSKAIPHTPPFDPEDYYLVLNSVKVSLSQMETKTFYEAHVSDLRETPTAQLSCDNNNLEATKKDDDQSNATGVAKSTVELGEAQESSRKRCRAFQESWKTRRSWLKFDEKENAMFCSYCTQFSKDKSAIGSQKGNNSFRLDRIKKHEISEGHKTAKLAHDARYAQPGTTPLEACLINMEKEALDRLVKLFHTTGCWRQL